MAILSSPVWAFVGSVTATSGRRSTDLDARWTRERGSLSEGGMDASRNPGTRSEPPKIATFLRFSGPPYGKDGEAVRFWILCSRILRLSS